MIRGRGKSFEARISSFRSPCKACATTSKAGPTPTFEAVSEKSQLRMTRNALSDCGGLGDSVNATTGRVLLQRPGQPGRGRDPLRRVAGSSVRSRSDRAGELRPRRRQAQWARDPVDERG